MSSDRRVTNGSRIASSGRVTRRGLVSLLVVAFAAFAAIVAYAGSTAGNAAGADKARADATITVAPAFASKDLNATPSADWLTTGGDAYNQRYSSLKQINASNVNKLKVAWSTHLDGSGKAAKFSAEGTPIVYKGVMYAVTGNDDVFALDAATGKHLWVHHSGLPATISTVCCGWDARGIALGQGLIFVAQIDGYLVALDQQTGKVRWKTMNARWQEGYTMTVSPSYYDGKVFVGVSGAEYGCRCSETAYNAATGARVWRFFAIPAPGEIGGGTWPANSEWQTGGGGIWGNPSFDPSTNTLVLTTGNADAYSGRGAGDNLFTSSFVALDVDTGQLKWFYQMVHHDIWDYDCPSPTLMFDTTIGGKLRHGIAEACKTAWVYELDRTNGKPLVGIKEVKVPQNAQQHTAATQPEPIGDAVAAQCARPQDYKKKGPDGKKIKTGCIFTPYYTKEFVASAPGWNGGIDWPPMSFNPGTHALYVCASNTSTAYEAIPLSHQQQFVGGLPFYNVAFNGATALITWGGTFTALDANTNRILWQKKFSGTKKKPDYCYSGSFTTAGNLVFLGRNDGTFEAFNAASGAKLWSQKLPYGANAPGMTYSVGGKQYIAVYDGGSSGDGGGATKHGDAIYAFTKGDTAHPVTSDESPKPKATTKDSAKPKATTKDSAKSKATVVNVTEKEYKFILSRESVPVGKVTFVITNKGTIPHNMVFQGPAVYATTPLIAANATTKLTVSFKKPGTYSFLCTPHFELGMTGHLKVVKA